MQCRSPQAVSRRRTSGRTGRIEEFREAEPTGRDGAGRLVAACGGGGIAGGGDGAVDGGKEGVGIEGLGHVFVGAAVGGAGAAVVLVEGGEDDDGDGGGAAV